MYFVVYLNALAKNVLIPANWIYDIGRNVEKFINNGINRNQYFLCYYTNKPDAFVDGQPDENIVPEFKMNLITKVNPGDQYDGVFFGNVIRFQREYYYFETIIHCQ